jgi:hypothetical protein
MYGLEMNPFVFLWSGLRRRYAKEWFDAANLRESRWIRELRAEFTAPRWHCLDGVKLKRNGKTITDIDFVAHDACCNSVILFQLKWQQPFVSDDKVRRNNASTLVNDSNKWISDVVRWVDDAGTIGVKDRLSIRTDSDLRVYLVVLGRYHAHFTSSQIQDRRAVWCDWGNFIRLRNQLGDSSADELVEVLAGSTERAKAEVKPESFFFPLGDETLVLVNPTRTNLKS